MARAKKSEEETTRPVYVTLVEVREGGKTYGVGEVYTVDYSDSNAPQRVQTLLFRGVIEEKS